MRPVWGWIIATLAGVVLAKVLSAGQILEAEVARTEGEGLLIEGLSIALDLESSALLLKMDGLTVGDGPPLAGIRLHCGAARVGGTGDLSCRDGGLRFSHPLTGDIVLSVARIHWQGDAGGSMVLDGVPLLGDGVGVEVSKQGVSGWRLRLDAPAADLSDLTARLQLAGLVLTGDASLQAAFDFSDTISGNIIVEHRSLAFQSADGDWLGDALEGRLSIDLAEAETPWQGRFKADWTGGELLTPFAYAAASPENPVLLESRVQTADDGETLLIDDLRLRQAPWVRLDGSAELALGGETGIRQMTLKLAPADLGELHQRYLAPVLVSPLLGALTMDGRVSGEFRQTGAAPPKVRVRLDGVDILDDTDAARFSVEGLSGDVAMGMPGATGELSWRSASVFRFGIGEAALPLRFGDREVALATPATIPLLDGSLDIDEFSVGWRQPSPEVSFDAVLVPVSMPLVSEALGWIPMQGQLSGVIPRVSMSGGTLQVGGSLLMRVFDGTVVVNNLRVSDLFGYWPVLTADVRARDLDLELLTGTYEFGRITGRLEGEVEGLRLEDWHPVAFDASFRTPEDDRSRHRISQRAVDNIAGLAGGGASGAVSRGVLRFFDEFNYDRLGISCELRHGVCEMDGIAPAKNGFYLVKGGGIPRIDVVGFTRSTDWETLLDRLASAASGGSPVIE